MTQAVQQPRRRYTLSEYFDLEYAAETRHEYIDGEILDMSGGTFAHDKISMNTGGELRHRLKGSPCGVSGPNLRIRYGTLARYGYADAFVICGGPQFDPADPRQLTVLNPTLVVEVLSDSTERFDRGRKFAFYRENPTFVEYVLIEQDRPRVEVHSRQPDGGWLMRDYVGLAAVAPLPSVGVELPLAEVYLGVTFPPDPDDEGVEVPTR